MSKPIPIGAYEAKTHLPRLLREVEAGQSFTINVRGKPVAELRPVTLRGCLGGFRRDGCGNSWSAAAGLRLTAERSRRLSKRAGIERLRPRQFRRHALVVRGRISGRSGLCRPRSRHHSGRDVDL